MTMNVPFYIFARNKKKFYKPTSKMRQQEQNQKYHDVIKFYHSRKRNYS